MLYDEIYLKTRIRAPACKELEAASFCEVSIFRLRMVMKWKLFAMKHGGALKKQLCLTEASYVHITLLRPRAWCLLVVNSTVLCTKEHGRGVQIDHNDM